MQKRHAGIIFFTTFVVLLQGCVVTTGRKIPLDMLNGFQTGKTTAQEIEAVFGSPETVVENTIDHSIIYSYQWIVSRVIGIGLPPWLVLGRKADTGYQVNIAFMNGTYIGYAITTHAQSLFKRKPAGAREEAQ